MKVVRNTLPLVSGVAHKMQWRGYLNTIIFRLVKAKLIFNFKQH
jgi:hypothetical protein